MKSDRILFFSNQECKLKFGSWTSNGNEVDLALYHNASEGELLNFYTDNREWQIIQPVKAVKKTAYYSCCDEGYPDITFTFKLKRDSPGYRYANSFQFSDDESDIFFSEPSLSCHALS